MKKRTARPDPKKIDPRVFEKMELRVGTIVGVKRHPKIKEAYVLLVDVGIVDHDYQVVASIARSFTMTELMAKQVTIVCNVKPQKVGGIESQALLLLTSKNNKPMLIKPAKKTYPGVRVFGMMNGEYYRFYSPGDE